VEGKQGRQPSPSGLSGCVSSASGRRGAGRSAQRHQQKKHYYVVIYFRSAVRWAALSRPAGAKRRQHINRVRPTAWGLGGCY